MTKKALIANDRDNVATALADIKGGEMVYAHRGDQEIGILVKNPIIFGHKFALTGIKRGEEVIKYGEPIGIATEDIEQGDHVHVHNIASQRGRGDLKR
ncbi:MAG: Altronate dehydratase [Firmicutes bacterium]|nr:Altronate dehydratase [Bacillota bacterium]MDI6705518.1 UxaA family hydrolase [Bacillota bacterium]